MAACRNSHDFNACIRFELACRPPHVSGCLATCTPCCKTKHSDTPACLVYLIILSTLQNNISSPFSASCAQAPPPLPPSSHCWALRWVLLTAPLLAVAVPPLHLSAQLHALCLALLSAAPCSTNQQREQGLAGTQLAISTMEHGLAYAPCLVLLSAAPCSTAASIITHVSGSACHNNGFAMAHRQPSDRKQKPAYTVT
jgi:hypothetical protein